MKDTITISRAEYEHLNKAANAAVEHACELFRASRLVDELKARVAELENLYQKRGEAYEEERKEHEAALEVEEKRRWTLEDVINELLSRIDELEAARDAIQADGEELLEENKALTLEKADLIREKHAAESRAELAECFLDMTHDAIDAAALVARGSGDYKGQIEYLAEVAKRFEL